MTELIEVKKIYKEKTALDIPRFRFEDGRHYALIGANGSGKSTLLRILAKTLRPDEGTVVTGDKTAYMPQNSLGFNMSVQNNLLAVRKDKDEAFRLLEKLKLAPFAKKNASRLSGGETQRLSLARCMMKDFDLLLLDEPSSAMDIESQPLAETLIQEKTVGKTLIFATHSLAQAERLADFIVYLENGKIVEMLPAADFRKHCADPLTVKFISNF